MSVISTKSRQLRLFTIVLSAIASTCRVTRDRHQQQHNKGHLLFFKLHAEITR